MELVLALNDVLRSGSIYDKERFCDVHLREETETLLSQPPEGEEIARLNRLLLEDAYPDDIQNGALGLDKAGEDAVFGKFVDLQTQATERRARETEF